MINTAGRSVFIRIKNSKRKFSFPFPILNAMPLPVLLSRRNPNVHKNQFGHVLVLAGSRGMLGAAALTGLAAMRAGSGLATIGVPASLNLALQKKISPVIMTLPFKETKEQSLHLTAYNQIKEKLPRFQAIA